jgi:hypothetical protein
MRRRSVSMTSACTGWTAGTTPAATSRCWVRSDTGCRTGGSYGLRTALVGIGVTWAHGAHVAAVEHDAGVDDAVPVRLLLGRVLHLL